MPKVAVINGGNTGSTGKVMLGIREAGLKEDFSFEIFTPRGRRESKEFPDNIFIGSKIERRLSEKVNQYTGFLDSLNIFNTIYLISQLKKFEPDIIHLHNLHGNYINLEKLFKYLEKANIPVIWTLHDCWAFTGQCSHFTITGCEKWLTGCYDCPSIDKYPNSYKDKTKELYLKKKRLFTSINKMTIVTPSEWLAGKVKESFLNKYPIEVINNGVNTEVFLPEKGSFKKDNAIEDKFMILSVSPSWSYSKGIDRIKKLAEKLDDRFVMVIVGGLAEKIDSEKVICIPRTNNQQELAELYSVADVFFNPTRQDTFPTVNLEALACGTPVVSYGACGSAEAFDETSGKIVSDENIVEVMNELYENNFSQESCLKKGLEFEQNKKFEEYITLYKIQLENK